jgi:hypothetical protein
LPHLEQCFACDVVGMTPAQKLPPEATFRVRVSHAMKAPDRLWKALAALAPQFPAGDLERLRDDSFELGAVLRAPEQARLCALLDACGALYAPALDTPASTSLTVARDPVTLAKVGVTLAMGAGAAVFAVPLVPYAAAAMLLLLAVRSVRLQTRLLPIERTRVTELLGPISPRAIAAFSLAARGATDDRMRSALRACLAALLELAAVARLGCAHLVQDDMASVDAGITQLAQRLARRAMPRASAGEPGAAAPAPSPYRTDADGDAPAIAALATAAETLAPLAGRLSASGDTTATLGVLRALASEAV